jgi:hypothetical protein
MKKKLAHFSCHLRQLDEHLFAIVLQVDGFTDEDNAVEFADYLRGILEPRSDEIVEMFFSQEAGGTIN